MTIVEETRASGVGKEKKDEPMTFPHKMNAQLHGLHAVHPPQRWQTRAHCSFIVESSSFLLFFFVVICVAAVAGEQPIAPRKNVAVKTRSFGHSTCV